MRAKPSFDRTRTSRPAPSRSCDLDLSRIPDICEVRSWEVAPTGQNDRGCAKTPGQEARSAQSDGETSRSSCETTDWRARRQAERAWREIMIAGGARQRFTLNLRAKTEILLGNAAVVAASAMRRPDRRCSKISCALQGNGNAAMKLAGRVWKVGDNVSATDLLSPAYDRLASRGMGQLRSARAGSPASGFRRRGEAR